LESRALRAQQEMAEVQDARLAAQEKRAQETHNMQLRQYALQMANTMSKQEQDKALELAGLWAKARNEQELKMMGGLYLQRHPEDRPQLNRMMEGGYTPEKHEAARRYLMTLAQVIEEDEGKDRQTVVMRPGERLVDKGTGETVVEIPVASEDEDDEVRIFNMGNGLLVDENGQVVFDAGEPEGTEKPITLREGERLVSATGKLLYEYKAPRDTEDEPTKTMKPGDRLVSTRTGKVIAEYPKDEDEERPMVLKPGDAVYRGGKVVYREPKSRKTFTLSPGQEVHDDEGNIIASVKPGKKRRTVTLSAGEQVVDLDSGDVVARGPEKETTYKLRPGDRVVGSKGETVAEYPTTKDDGLEGLSGDARLFYWIYRRPPDGPEEYRDFAESISPDNDDAPTFANVASLRNAFIKMTDDYRTVRDSYGRVQASAKNPSAAGDLALIFNYMKILDPGSVVRESEFATARNAAGVPERIRRIYNRVLEGKQLGTAQRKDFVSRAEKLYKSMMAQYEKDEHQFRELAVSFGMDPQQVIVDMSPPKEADAYLRKFGE